MLPSERFHCALFIAVLFVCGTVVLNAQPQSTPSPEPIEKPGLHNVYRMADWLISGSVPEGQAGFRSLKELGIKTVITVDGAKPDVALAKEHGMRYVHIPIGYDGIPRDKLLQLAKAAKDLPQPVYVHCHHGKHRGPAAAAAIHLCLDSRCTVSQAVAEMRTFGTDPRYQGLFNSIRRIERPSADELKKLPGDFPETAKIGSFTQRMVEVDATWDHIKAIRAAGWKTPADNPDLVPAQEALQLMEHYREAARLPNHADRPATFREFLKAAEMEAANLEKTMRAAGQQPLDATQMESLYKRSDAACASCHSRYRDVAH